MLWAWTNTCLQPNCLAEEPGNLPPKQLIPAVKDIRLDLGSTLV